MEWCLIRVLVLCLVCRMWFLVGWKEFFILKRVELVCCFCFFILYMENWVWVLYFLIVFLFLMWSWFRCFKYFFYFLFYCWLMFDVVFCIFRFCFFVCYFLWFCYFLGKLSLWKWYVFFFWCLYGLFCVKDLFRNINLFIGIVRLICSNLFLWRIESFYVILFGLLERMICCFLCFFLEWWFRKWILMLGRILLFVGDMVCGC